MAREVQAAGSLDRGWRALVAGTWWPATVCLALGLGASESCLAQETPVGIIAAHIRMQGYTCDDPRQAERDAKASKPNETVWTLDCGNATYRVTLVPNMAARVEVKKNGAGK